MRTNACSVATVFAVLVVLMYVDISIAQPVTFDGCIDIAGRPVASIMNTGVPDVAVARLGPHGEPLIIYNPMVLARLEPQTRLFFYAHECAHHALGHAFFANPTSIEQEADCWGIRTIYERGLVNDNDVSVIQRDLSFSSGDWTHLPGPPRAFNLRRCLGLSTTRKSPRGSGDSCTYANDSECDEPDLCPPGTDATDCAPQRHSQANIRDGKVSIY